MTDTRSYAEASYAGQPLLGPANATPAHFHHIAAYEEQERLNRIAAKARAAIAAYRRTGTVALRLV